MIEINGEENFEKLLQSEKTLIVDFWANYCQPCKVMLPIFEQFSQKYSAVTAAKINLMNNLDIGTKQKILNVPCLVVFKDGKEVARVIGFKGAEALEDLFKRHS